jgi:dTMP kinase
MKGKFIVFEGLDGSGHTTQAELLEDFFKRRGRKTLYTHEPTYATAASKKIKQVLTHQIKMEPLAFQKLYVEDREWHSKYVIRPALRKGVIVLEDRYYFSTFAFGSLGDVPLEKLIRLNKDFPKPDLTFIFKVRPEVCLARIGMRGKGFELHDTIEKLSKVWKVYERMPTMFPDVYIVDGEKTIEEVHKDVVSLSAGKI